jgi:hypothetical protein
VLSVLVLQLPAYLQVTPHAIFFCEKFGLSDKTGPDGTRYRILGLGLIEAFDQGIFTISDQYEVLIHPKAKSATVKQFPLFEQDRKPIHLPKEDFFFPHQEALQWHRDEVYGKFAS